MCNDTSKQKVIICIPTLKKPYKVTLDSVEACLPSVEAAGFDHGIVFSVGCPYVSQARAVMLRKALDARADHIVFIDHDVSWKPQDMVRLLKADGDVVCGTYRFKRDAEEYMGRPMYGPSGKPLCRESDNAILMHSVPAGFLKITKKAVNLFMAAYPELIYGDLFSPHIDLFNHGAHEGTWYGEDYAFSRRWREQCGDIWCVPDLTITHHTEDKAYPGNYHEFLLKLGSANGDSSADN